MGLIAFILALAVVGLWFVSGRCMRRGLTPPWRNAALLVVLLAAAFVLYAFVLSAPLSARPRWWFERWAEPATLPVFALLPFAVCALMAQRLRRLPVAQGLGRGLAAVAGLGMALLAPFLSLAVGCSMAGVCL